MCLSLALSSLFPVIFVVLFLLGPCSREKSGGGSANLEFDQPDGLTSERLIR